MKIYGSISIVIIRFTINLYLGDCAFIAVGWNSWTYDFLPAIIIDDNGAISKGGTLDDSVSVSYLQMNAGNFHGTAEVHADGHRRAASTAGYRRTASTAAPATEAARQR